jgi:alpha-beta hydrolase superfamily lysophospholipase
MPTARTYAVGGYFAGEKSTALVPTDWKGDGTIPGVIYCHGYGEDGLIPTLPAQNGQFSNLTALVAAGYPVLACDLGGSLWGYDPFRARVDSAITYLQGTVGAKAGKVVVVGTSMGGLGALVYAANNPTKVSGVVGIGPTSDMQHVVSNNDGGLAAIVNAAYPGGYSDATYGATFNPQVLAAAGKFTMPVRLWIGSADTTVIPSTVTTLANTIGANATISYLSGGHAESTWFEVDSTALVKFVKTSTGT